jgi:hypothetical protein
VVHEAAENKMQTEVFYMEQMRMSSVDRNVSGGHLGIFRIARKEVILFLLLFPHKLEHVILPRGENMSRTFAVWQL